MSDSFNVAACIPMNKDTFERWLSEHPASPSRFSDWKHLYSAGDWSGTPVNVPRSRVTAKSIADLIAQRARQAPQFQNVTLARHQNHHLLLFDQVANGPDLAWTLQTLSLLRQSATIEGFDTKQDGYAVLWADIAGRHPEAKGVLSLMRIGVNTSEFISKAQDVTPARLKPILNSLRPSTQLFARFSEGLDEEGDNILFCLSSLDVLDPLIRKQIGPVDPPKPPRSMAPIPVHAPVEKLTLNGLENTVRNGDPKDANVIKAISSFNFRWGDNSINKSLWSFAQDWLRFRAVDVPHTIRASLAISAFRQSKEQPALSQQILRWIRPGLKDTSRQIAIIAGAGICYGERNAALGVDVFTYLFENNLATEVASMGSPYITEALWSVLSLNNHHAIQPARHRLFLKQGALCPKDKRVLYNMACVATELGDAKAAKTYIKKAMAIDPTLSPELDLHGMLPA